MSKEKYILIFRADGGYSPIGNFDILGVFDSLQEGKIALNSFLSEHEDFPYTCNVKLYRVDIESNQYRNITFSL